MTSDSEIAENRIPWLLSPPVALLSGMAVCHIIAALWIYASNQEYHAILQVLNSQGYLVVPNKIVQPLLLEFKTAFFSAVFYTFTLGVGLSLVFMAVGMFCGKIQRFWAGLCIFLLFWAYFFFLNANWGSWQQTAFFILIPPAPAAIMWRRNILLRRQPSRGWAPQFFFVLPVVILGLLWAFQSSKDPFVDLRDAILLNNKPGLAVNDFYYDYTLYAARTFKPLDKRAMRTVYLSGNPNSKKKMVLRNKLLAAYYFVVEDKNAADIVITYGDGKDAPFILEGWCGRKIESLAYKEFLHAPGKHLEALADQCDLQKNFRSTVYSSLLLGLPMGIYTFLFSIMAGLASIWLGRKKGAAITAAVWMVIGLSLYTQLAYFAHRGQEGKPPQELLESSSSRERLAGLRNYMSKDLNIREHAVYDDLLHSPKMAERYWLARVLAHNQDKESLKDLLFLLKDPSPNVRCQAIWALGRRPWDRPSGYLEDIVKNSDHYYVQLYAYNALRRLGWRQQI